MIDIFFSNSCVPNQQCKTTLESLGPRDNDLTQQGLAESAKCSNSEQSCCHQHNIIPEKDCSFYSRDGYKCVKQSMCLDTFISSSGIGIDIRSFDEETNPQLAACDDTGDGELLIL